MWLFVKYTVSNKLQKNKASCANKQKGTRNQPPRSFLLIILMLNAQITLRENL